jgi:N-acetylglucosamine-6-sulfatase
VTQSDPEVPGGGYPALDSGSTLPVWLRAAGYHTTFVGKYLNGDPLAAPPGWSDWHALKYHRYNMYGYGISHNGVERRYGTAPADYQTDVLADLAVDAVKARAPAAQPFFLWVAPAAPHSETADGTVGPDSGPRPAPRHVGTYGSEPLPRPPSFNEADMGDKPSYLRNKATTDVESLTKRFRNRIEALRAVDELVERVVGALRDSGELGNTLLIFTSDNGFLLGQHRVIGKTWVYEESMRVPLLVRGGGFPAGRTASQLVANIDLAPTILQAAGASAGRTMDGRPLQGLPQDPARGAGRALLLSGVTHPAGATLGPLHFKAVRTERYLWVEYEGGPRELYDVKADPHQLTSRHADPALASTRTTLMGQLGSLRSCRGTGCSRGAP